MVSLNLINKLKILSFQQLLILINLKLLVLLIEKNSDYKTKLNIKEHLINSKIIGQEIFIIESIQKNKPSLKHLDAWNVLIVHAKKHAQLVLISGHLSIKFKIKTIMVLPKLFFLIILLDCHVEVYAQSVNFVLLLAMHIGLREVPLK